MKIFKTSLIAAMLCTVSGSAFAGGWATSFQGENIITALKSNDNNTVTVGENVKDVERQLKSELQTLGNRLEAALRASRGEGSAYADKQIEATKRLMDASEQNEVQNMRNAVRAAAESGDFDPDPDACLLIDIFNTPGTTSSYISTGQELVASAQSLNSGADPAVRQGGGALARAVVNDREAYADAFDGFSDATVDPGVLTLQKTIDVSDPDQAAALERLTRNMIDPNPPKPVTALEITTPAGVARAHAQSARATRNNATAAWIAYNTERNKAIGPVTSAHQKMIDGIPGYEDRSNLGTQLSEWQLLEIFNLSDYQKTSEEGGEAASWTEKQLLARILRQIAIGNRIAYLDAEVNTHIAAMTSQILSTLNNN